METPNYNPTPQEENRPSSIGPLVGIIIILVVIILGGLYFWGQRLERNNYNPEPEQQQEESVGVADLEAELNSTNIDATDSELENIDAEFEAN